MQHTRADEEVRVDDLGGVDVYCAVDDGDGDVLALDSLQPQSVGEIS